MAFRMFIMLLIVGVILGGVIGFVEYKPTLIRNIISAQPPPRQTVSTAKAESQAWQRHISAIGSLRAVNGADLSSEVSGIVDSIDFKSGDEVPAGALLVKLRADDDIAKLHSLQAQADLAKIVLDRDQKQFKAQAVSQAIVDTDTANLKNAIAQVAEQQATVDKKFVHAPFSGRLGIRAIDLGQFLSAGTAIVTLQQIDPIFMDFTLPQQTLPNTKIGSLVNVTIDAFPGESFTGEIAAVSPKVDTTTRNLQVRATIKNPDHKLLPGMYGSLDLAIGAPERHITVPQTAIVYNSYGNSIYTVDDKGLGADGSPSLFAHQSFVTTGDTRGDQIAVITGLKEGDTIITAGQVKLHNGSPIAINNSVLPLNDANPHPIEQ